MDHLQYLGLLAACLVFTVPLEFIYGFKVWRNPRRLVRAVFPGLVLFSIWDVVAIHRGHWSYAPRYTTGIDIGNLPLEEILFFIIVPAAAISGYEAVSASLSRRG